MVAIAAGFMHSLALHKNGQVYAWGDDQFGQIYVPVGLGDVTRISAGAMHSAALRRSGNVVVWGDNSFGQLQLPAEAHQNITAISAGFYHTLALTADGRVVAWGDNSFNQCAIPDEALSDVVAITAGETHSLALKRDGSLVAWGSDIPVVIDSSTPQLLDIAAGGSHVLGLAPTEQDTDGDGLPDAWEIEHGLDDLVKNDPALDSDGDGVSDQYEYIADSDPRNRDDYFRLVMQANPTTGFMDIQFSPARSTRNYTLEAATDLANNQWRPVTKNVIISLGAGDIGTMSLSSTEAGGSYRISVNRK
jgi:alpha-tubulin suppressor-like RCC1 family protein